MRRLFFNSPKSGHYHTAWLAAAWLAGALAAPAGENWPQFRGPTGQGESTNRGPLTWGETSHVRWKTALPGRGHSSPIVWNGRVWLTTATDSGRSLRAMAVDFDSGKIVRDLELFHRADAEPLVVVPNGYASPTPAAAAGVIVTSFGPNGVAGLDPESGRVLWRQTGLTYHHDGNGAGSSPIIHGALAILNCDGADTHHVAALRLASGKVAWKIPRSSTAAVGAEGKSFSTPLVIRAAGRELLVSPGAHRVSAYEPATGREVWFCDLPGVTIVPRPVFAGGLVFVCTGFPKAELWAIRPDGTGDVTRSHVAWKYARQVPHIATPVADGENLFLVSDSGLAACLELNTGRERWSERLGGNHYASPLAAAGRIYFFNAEGDTKVVAADRKFSVLATNRLEGGCYASPAVIGGALLLRTETHLYRIEE
ncbi:MAG: PQQ-binding-like beta-propeller repeat protein [Verrucomicrobia bacterium]|nr:PQQ-binding-like beta-propeller repeat protein [Verrucomicrobiota bacterium]